MIQIRPYEESDAQIIKEKTDDYSFNKLMDYEDNLRHVILRDNNITGFLILSLSESRIQSSYLYIYIFKEYRRKGIASEVYRSLEEKLKSASTSWWTDYDMNSDTDAFCLKVGFDEVHPNLFLTYEGDILKEDYNKIRIYRDEDFEIASSIWTDEYRKMHEQIGIVEENKDIDKAELERIYHENMDSTYVVEDDGKIIGVGQLFEEASGIGNIAITSEYQNKGYGKKLLSFLVDECIKKGNSHPVLYCEPANEKALRLYLNTGFEITKRETYAVKRI